MFLSYNIISRYIDISDIKPLELLDLLNKHSIEIDSYINVCPSTNLVTGQILDIEKHPNADKLNICTVDWGNGPKKIVCGASNVRTGMKVIVAKIGAVLKNDFVIKESEIRGIRSEGMLCSLSEILNIDIDKKYSDGIFDVPESIKTGTNPIEELGLDDHLFELGLTVNRNDLMSIIGHILEIKAITRKDITLFPNITHSFKTDMKNEIDLKNFCNPSHLKYYSLTKATVSGINDTWFIDYTLMINKIELKSPIQNIKNFVTLFTNQPITIYDYDKLGSDKFTLRYALKNEKLEVDNKTEIELNENDMCIYKNTTPFSILGVESSKYYLADENTKNVLIEIAAFDEGIIRKIAKSHQIRNDSTSRIEKRIPENAPFHAIHLFAFNLTTHSESAKFSETSFIGNLDINEHKIKFTHEKFVNYVGQEIDKEKVFEILSLCSIDYTFEDNTYYLIIPNRLNNIIFDVDVFGIILRLIGYDNIDNKINIEPQVERKINKKEKINRQITNYFEKQMFNEVISYTLTDDDSEYNWNNYEAIKLIDKRLFNQLRTSLLKSLLYTYKENIKQKNNNVSIFEISNILQKGKTFNHFACLVSNNFATSIKKGNDFRYDFFKLKSTIINLFIKLNIDINKIEFKNNNEIKGLHPNIQSSIYYNGDRFGIIGKTFNEDIFLCEFNIDVIQDAHKISQKFTPISNLPTTTRDISVIVESKDKYNDIKKIIIDNKINFLNNIEVIDYFSDDEKIGKGKMSMLIRLTYQNPSETIKNEDVEENYKHILSMIEEKYTVKRGDK